MNPGSAISGQFQFSMATVCVAPQANFKIISPLAHSIGLVKNVKIDADPSTVDLTQGIRQDVVATVVNKMDVTCSMEVYEYSTKNLAYGLGLDGSGYTISADAVPATAASAALSSTVTVASANGAQFTVGAWAYIQENKDDQVYVFKVASVASGVITMAAGYSIPTGLSFTTNARVGLINKIDADPSISNNYFSVKIIGTAQRDNRPLIICFPKVRITKGFSVAFNDSSFGNLPFEMSPMVPMPGDVGYDTDFRQIMTVLST